MQCFNANKRCRYKSSGLKRKSALRNLQEFSANTTLHGIRYIGEPHRHLFERLCWLTVVLICTSGCLFYIYTLLQRWNHSPVIVTFAERSTPIWDIPFPAVTICPDNRIPKSKYDIFPPSVEPPRYLDVINSEIHRLYSAGPPIDYNFSLPILNNSMRINYTMIDTYNTDVNVNQSYIGNKLLWTYTNYTTTINFTNTYNDPYYNSQNQYENSQNSQHNESMEWEAASMMCSELKHESILNRSHVETYVKISTGEERFLQCRWGSDTANCTQWFRPILTDLGVCFTFNMIQPNNLYYEHTDVHSDILANWMNDTAELEETTDTWDPDLGYGENADKDAYPLRVAGRGARSGLDIVFSAAVEELQPSCWPNAKSYKILLHSPAEFPKVSDQHFRVPINSLVTVAVRPTMVTTSEALKAGGYTPEVRGCYFRGERNLQHFKVYSQNNCETECLTQNIAEKCECIPFYLPRLKTDDTRYCSSNDAECIRETEYSMTWSEGGGTLRLQCNCLPSCTEHKYDIELSSTQIDKDEIETYSSNQDDAGLDQSKITIHFKETQFITSQRREQYGLIDFIANCGGLLGLFTGFSIISLFEIIYYATVRMFCHFRKRKILDCEDGLKEN